MKNFHKVAREEIPTLLIPKAMVKIIFVQIKIPLTTDIKDKISN